jgi:DNA-binding CsgD family transcriptional regulator
MPDAELLALIGELYDAALNPALWASALDKSSAFVGLHADRRGVDDSNGWIDAATALLDTPVAGAGFPHEPDGAPDDGVRNRLALLTPHIRRAILIGKTIQLRRAEADALADTFDGLTAGLFLADASGRLIRANSSGQMMLVEEAVLRAAGGRLIACDPAADRLLRQAFAGTQAVAVPLPANDGQRYVAHVLPLVSGPRRTDGAGYAAAAAIFVRKATLGLPAKPDVIAELYGLTPTELRVLLAVFDSGNGPDIAATLGVAPGTVKTHLRRLFVKTGSKRQADLVKLVAACACRP